MDVGLEVSEVYEPVCLALLQRVLAELGACGIHPLVSVRSPAHDSLAGDDPDDGAVVVVSGVDDPPTSDGTGPSAMLAIHVTGLRGRIVLAGDDQQAYIACLTHLGELGHRHIAFLSGDSGLFGNRGRRRDFLRASSHCRGVETPTVLDVDHTTDAAANAVRTLYGKGVTAIICSTDMLASAVIHEAVRMELRVPRDLSVVGYGDSPEAALQEPELTTIRLPFARASKSVAQILQEYAASGSIDVSRLWFRSEFIIRRSTGSSPRGGEESR